jgi:hypothetical protein
MGLREMNQEMNESMKEKGRKMAAELYVCDKSLCRVFKSRRGQSVFRCLSCLWL